MVVMYLRVILIWLNILKWWLLLWAVETGSYEIGIYIATLRNRYKAIFSKIGFGYINTNLPASIEPNANLSVVGTSVFQVTDAATTAQNGSTITFWK